MRNGLKLLVLTLPLIGLGGGYLALTMTRKAPPARIELAERTTPVRVVTLRDGALAPVVRGHGLVRPAETFEAIAEVAGTVVWVNPELKRGAVLPAGAALVRLSQADFALALAQAEANLRAAEARRAELAVSGQNQRAALAIETEALALKAADLARAESLHAGGTLPQAGLDGVRAAHLTQRQKVQSLESSLALLPTQDAVLAESIAVAEAARDSAGLNLARTEIRLPVAARVASVAVEVGRFVRAGEVTASLDAIAVAEAEAQVPVARLREVVRLAAPDAAAVAADPAALTRVLGEIDLRAEILLALGDETLRWPARVARVSDAVDPKTGTLGLIVEAPGPFAAREGEDRPPLTKGMFVEVLVSGPPVAGLVAPRAALRGDRLGRVGPDDRLNFATATRLLVQDDLVLLAPSTTPGDTAGIAAGDRIVVSDLLAPVAGLLLAPVEDEALARRLEAAK